MDFPQTIKAEHARANEIMDRLGDTSDGAVKTRERLAGQLQTLLSKHMQREQDNLYPALQSHDQAQEFLAGAREAHDDIVRRLGEIDAMPKDGSEFLPRLGELRRAVQHHFRDEERILGTVRRAMSEEEARRLDAAFSGEEAGGDRRARAPSEPAGAAQAMEGARGMVPEAADRTERTGQSVLAAAEIYSETAQQTAEDLQAIATCSTIAAGGMGEMRHAWMDWLGRTLRASARASQELLRCTTIEQVADVQRSFLKESLDNLFEGSAQMLRISSRLSEDARRPIEDRAMRGHSGSEERQRRTMPGSA